MKRRFLFEAAPPRSIDRAARLGAYLARRHERKAGDSYDPWHQSNETIYLNKFNDTTFKEVEKAYYAKKLHMHPTGGFTKEIEIHPDELLPTQHITYFNPSYYKNKKAHDHTPIKIVKKNGKFHIVDGHHRWLDAKLRKKKLKGLYADLDEGTVNEEWKLKKKPESNQEFDYYSYPKFEHNHNINGVPVKTTICKRNEKAYPNSNLPPMFSKSNNAWEIGFSVGDKGENYSSKRELKHSSNHAIRNMDRNTGFKVYHHVMKKVKQFMDHANPHVVKLLAVDDDTVPMYSNLAKSLANKYGGIHHDRGIFQFIEFPRNKK